ncbi:MAG: hypothetical protein ACFFDW_13025 [Candidatus Thorarchaeota archaeon]
MLKKRFFAISLLSVLVIGMTVVVSVEAYIPPEVLHFYKYLDDDASYLAAANTEWGGTAYVSYGDMDYLELYCDTDGWLETALAQSWFDGGDDANSPWTFSMNEYYSLRIYWDISGYFTRDHSNYLSFYYALYYMEGSTQHIVMSRTTTYTSSFDYDDVTVSHYVGAANLDTTKTYYLYGRIILYHSAFTKSR